MNLQNKETDKETFEYYYCIKVLNNLTDDVLTRINHIFNEFNEVVKSQPKLSLQIIKPLAQTYRKLLNLKQEKEQVFEAGYINQQLVVDKAVLMTDLVCEMISKIKEITTWIEGMSVPQNNKVLIYYQFEYLESILKKIIE